MVAKRATATGVRATAAKGANPAVSDAVMEQAVPPKAEGRVSDLDWATLAAAKPAAAGSGAGSSALAPMPSPVSAARAAS
jgi:hypothetical protein